MLARAVATTQRPIHGKAPPPPIPLPPVCTSECATAILAPTKSDFVCPVSVIRERTGIPGFDLLG